jgi:DNA-binding winged helix-turn-helix (wHTH) protein/Tol biopolymer transport system component
MSRPPQTSKRAAFAGFELDLQTAELHNNGKKVVLPGQPFRVLTELLERSGELVTREELKKGLWPLETFGEFDQGLNKAINRLREVLEDDPEQPRFIETLPRRGYRWIAPVQWESRIGTAALSSSVSVSASEFPVASPTSHAYGHARDADTEQVKEDERQTEKQARRFAKFAAIAVAALILAATGLFVGKFFLQALPPSFRRMTFQRGYIPAARFSADGQTILYSAAWEGAEPELFSTRPDYPGYRNLAMGAANLLAISSSGEIALARHPEGASHVGNFSGTLASAPLSGGPPRDLMENVVCADWTPDAKQMAVVRIEGDDYRLEFPAGKTLFQSTGYISNPRISPDGKFVAFLDHPQPGDDRGMVEVIDSVGKRRVLTELWKGSVDGLAWSPKGDEIWFTAAPIGSGNSLYAVNLQGHRRILFHNGIRLVLQDVSKEGRVLLTEENVRFGIMALSSESNREHDLGWLDYSFLSGDLSPDGNAILFCEQGEGAGPNYSACIRKLDGSPALRLGEGFPTSLSADGKWVLSMLPDSTGRIGRIRLLPRGPGEPRTLQTGGVESEWARWFPSGNRILITGHAPGRPARSYVQSADTATPTPLTPETIVGFLVSPDGRSVLAGGPDEGQYSLYSIDGGQPRILPKMESGFRPFQWSPDGKFLYLRHGKWPAEIYRWNIMTGQKQFLRSVGPSDQAGLLALDRILIAEKEKTFVYQYGRITSDLFLVDGLK